MQHSQLSIMNSIGILCKKKLIKSTLTFWKSWNMLLCLFSAATQSANRNLVMQSQRYLLIGKVSGVALTKMLILFFSKG